MGMLYVTHSTLGLGTEIKTEPRGPKAQTEMSDFPLEGKFKWDQLLAHVGSPQLSKRMRQKRGGGGGGEGEFSPPSLRGPHAVSLVPAAERSGF